MNFLLKLTDHIEETFLAIVMIIMTLAVALQIFFRYVFIMPLDWSEELARFCFVWCIYMGISLACMRRKHLKVDAAVFLFPRVMRPWIELVGKALFFVFAAIVLYCSWQHFARITWIRPQLSPAMRAPMGIAYSAIPLSFGLVLIRLIQDVRKFFRDKEYRNTDVLARIAAEEFKDNT